MYILVVKIVFIQTERLIIRSAILQTNVCIYRLGRNSSQYSCTNYVSR